MNEDTSGGELITDNPVTAPEDDQLGYTEFAEDLAEAVTSRAPADGFTIGIYGEWGSGKSSILNFLEAELEEKNQNPILIRFNPWWFSGEADLIGKFFDELGSGIDNGVDTEDLRKNLATLSRALSVGAVPLKLVGIPFADRLFQKSAEVLDTPDKTVSEIRDEVADTLNKLDRRVVIVVDDIDRLHEEEIRQIFRLIKSVADFPNTVYILGFDPEIVSSALEGEQTGNESGREYLRKIVQLPIHIPTPESGSIATIFQSESVEIAGPDQMESQERWEKVYSEAISPELDTPRDAVRLANAVNMQYSVIGEEVNCIDLVALETLRLFHVDLFEEIRSAPEKFVGHPSSPTREREYSDEYFLDLVRDEETENIVPHLRNLLIHLFPATSNHFDVNTSGNGIDESRQQRRICHVEHTETYFRLAVPDSILSPTELSLIFSEPNVASSLATKLDEVLQGSGDADLNKLRQLLREVHDRAKGLVSSERENVIKLITERGDEIIRADKNQPHNSPFAQRQIFGVLNKMLEGVENMKRGDVLAEAIESSPSVYILCTIISESEKKQSSEEEAGIGDNLILPDSQVEEAENSVLETIKEQSQDSSLLETPQLAFVLDTWADIGSQQAVQDYISKQTNDEDGLITTLYALSEQVRVSTSSETRVEPRVDLDWLTPYFNIQEVYNRLKMINLTSYEDPKHSAAKAWKDELERHLDHL